MHAVEHARAAMEAGDHANLLFDVQWWFFKFAVFAGALAFVSAIVIAAGFAGGWIPWQAFLFPGQLLVVATVSLAARKAIWEMREKCEERLHRHAQSFDQKTADIQAEMERFRRLLHASV